MGDGFGVSNLADEILCEVKINVEVNGALKGFEACRLRNFLPKVEVKRGTTQLLHWPVAGNPQINLDAN
jgi:hypothetical protein